MSDDKIRVMCPNLRCRSILNIPVSVRGKIVRCARCGFRVKVPLPQESDAPESQPASSGG